MKMIILLHVGLNLMKIPAAASGFLLQAQAIVQGSGLVAVSELKPSPDVDYTQTYGSEPNAKYFAFVKEDVFTWRPDELFDLIFDYVFFCAIEPEMRPAWAKSMHELLKPDGELITLMYPITDHVGGAPYKVSVSAYEVVLVPLGFKALSIEENPDSIPTRKGKEKLGRWKKIN